MTPTYHVVPHSHWDREWYKSFEQFRAMLVEMIDDLLEIFRRDPQFRCFTLDGQTVVLEDYLAVRPDRKEEIRALVAEGKIVTGPWYILPDEFLVSAESTVRNLMTGIRSASAYGRAMAVGYIPDSFGHIAMMPAILRGFGIDTALVYRGFGGEPGEQTSEYWWNSPDGSRVLMTHLYRNGYSGGYFHDESEPKILEHFASLREELDARATTSQRLLMNGGDHHWPDPNLPSTLALLRKSFDARFEQSTVERYADAVKKEIGELPAVDGELRFGYRYAFAVMGGVYSSRMYIKQANWNAEMLLERYAEPLNAIAVASGMRSRAPLVAQAWRTLMKNHPHDSICGCSIDAVHAEMMTRFAAVRDIGNAVVETALEHIVPPEETAAGDDTALFLFNPSPIPRAEIAEAPVRFFLQDVVVGLNPDVAVDAKLPAVPAFALIDPAGNEVQLQVTSRDETYDIVHHRYNYPQQTRAQRFGVLIDTGDVPPMGFRGYRIEKRPKFTPVTPRVRAGKSFIENEFLRAAVGARGDVTLTDRVSGLRFTGLNVFEDTADVGDEYNYSWPRRDTVVRSTAARVTVAEKGPLRATLRVETTLRVPEAASPDRKSRSVRRVPMKITTLLSLDARSRFLSCTTTVDNCARDHRLRVLFPAGADTDRVRADSQFCIVERVQHEFNPKDFAIEVPARVAPMQRFVTAAGGDRALTLLAYGLPEYELKLDGRGTLALTLLRCVGLLAGDDLLSRPGGKAGWHNETPDAQCQGVHTFRYALLPHAPEEPGGGNFVTAQSEKFHLPLLSFRRKNLSPLPMESSLFSLEGDPLVLSALKEAEDGGGIVVRVYNPSPAPARGVLRCGRPVKGAHCCTLNEDPAGEIEVAAGPDGSAVPLSVGAGGILTLRVRL
ncbi:MAG TPA: glycoside hydrolase family 38 C-terminal domain-containing protein [Bacteroidota bacterium]|nr:glycoside hydrolase family 38 C-terminal domain-containing protein [Bacteroidota bacterium]